MHVGIVGAGQLARMTLQAAIPLAIPIRLLADRPDDGAALVAADVRIGSPDSFEALSALAESCEVVTFDHELVPFEHLQRLESAGHRLYPSAATMSLAQNKRLQRERFAAAGLPVPRFGIVRSVDEIEVFGNEAGWPLVLKAEQGGYDGRGVWMVDNMSQGRELVADLLGRGLGLVAEEKVPIDREVAILVARRPSGDSVVYPLVETVQVNGMCREILAPAEVPARVAQQAGEIAAAVAELSGAVGILAVELFVVGDRVLINEIATRPHNSGHYSIEGCVTGQFEQHLRAVLDWPLGLTALSAPAVATVNVVGGPDGSDPRPRIPSALKVPGIHVHHYGKGARPGRKLGHVTALGEDMLDARSRANLAAAILSGERVA